LVVTGAGAHVNAQDFKVTSDGATSKFTIAAATGNTATQGTLTVADTTTLNNGLDVTGSVTTDVHINAQNVRVTSNGATDKFTIEASSGNTVIEGTLDVNNHLTCTGNIEGDEIIATNGMTVSGAQMHINAQSFKVTSDGATDKFTISSAGATEVMGTLSVTGLATFNGGLEVAGAATHISGQNFKITSNGVAETFKVTASNGNVDVAGEITALSDVNTQTHFDTTGAYLVNNVQVVGAQQGAIAIDNSADPGDGTIASLAFSPAYADVEVQALRDQAESLRDYAKALQDSIDAVLAAMRTHGLIST